MALENDDKSADAVSTEVDDIFAGAEPEDLTPSNDPVARGDIVNGDVDDVVETVNEDVNEPEEKPKEDENTAETPEPEAPDADAATEGLTAAEETDGAEEDKDVEEEDDKKPGQVPAWRLREEASKRRAAEEELRRERSKSAAANGEEISIDMDVLKDASKMFDIALDGKVDEAAELFQKAIIEAAKMGANAAASKNADQIANALVEDTRALNESQVIAKLESTYSVLDVKSQDHDPVLTNRVLSTRDGLMANEGMSPAEALEEAADMVLRARRPDLFQEATAPAAPAAPAADPATVQKRIAAQQQQPPQLPTSADSDSRDSQGNDDVIDLTKYTEEELDALPESVWKRARGDYL